jgi:iron complex outermembrane recepter protein
MRRTNILITSAVAVFIESASAQARTPLAATEADGTALGGIRVSQANASTIEQEITFDIDATKLARALIELTEQSGLQLIYPAGDKVIDLPVKPLKGRYTTESALKQLLEGTGLSYEFIDARTISIIDPSEKSSARTSLRGTEGGLRTGLRLAQNSGASATRNTGEAHTTAASDSENRQNFPANPDKDSVVAIEEITVSASRIDRAGYTAPTPTTTLSEEEIRQGGRTDVGAAIKDLPQFRDSIGVTSTNTVTYSGVTSADLRGLGASHTLVLLNNRRFVSSADVNTVPFSLVKRLDVVTGGASAAWGSGAVSGVVNIILNDELEGLSFGAQGARSEQGDADKYLLTGSFGTRFAADRGHFMIGADYLQDDGIQPGLSRPNVGAAGFFQSAPGAFIRTRNLRYSIFSPGGVIMTGVLAGQTFNPDGTLRPYQFGEGPAFGLTIGGEGYDIAMTQSISAPSDRINLFARATYDLTDTAKIWIDGGYNRVWDERDFFPGAALAPSALAVLQFSIDNPFLPSAVRDQLTAAGETSFSMGRNSLDYAVDRFKFTRETLQGAVGIDGTFGNGWRYSGYFGHGQWRDDQKFFNNLIVGNFFEALDAVANPTPGGAPICRVALTDPNTACRPLNLFGEGNPSQAARDYITGTYAAVQQTSLDSAGVSLRGEPLSLWAGPLSVAVGAEWRKEQQDIASIDSLSAAGAFALNATVLPKSSFSVKEAFAEVAVPLLKDVPLLQDLQFNGAYRESDYSTSGSIGSWKLGLTNQVFDGLQLRAVRSRDIRSADLGELFSPAGIAIGTVFDPFTNTSPSVALRVGGNPNLQPELADTWTVGTILTPSFLPGFDLSVDYYKIEIQNIITSLTAEAIVTECFTGNQLACSQISRDGSGQIESINATFINVATFETKGIDVEFSYRFRLDSLKAGLPGTIRLRGLATHVQELDIGDGNVAGYVGGQAPFSTPKWRATATVTYENDKLGVDLRTRYVGSGRFLPSTFIPISNNDIAERIYVDLSGRHTFTLGDESELKVYADIANLFGRDPPVASLNSAFYDIVGRYFTAGVQVKF